MQTNLQELLDLPVAERARYARALIESLDQSVHADADAVWLSEIERRSREIESGEVELVDWTDLREDLRARRRRQGP